MAVSLHQRTPTVTEYINLCQSSGLLLPHPDVTPIGLARSLYAVCALDADQIVGMARVIGDGGIFFGIVDVAVTGDRQCRGIGRAIMQDVLAWLAINAHPTSFVTLAANKGTVGFYHRFGFVARDPDEPAMTHSNWGKTITLPIKAV